jgi:transcriptional regulator with XRE-family HTH domain
MSAEDDLFYEQLGRAIAKLRKERGLTQAQLAEMLGISQQHMLSFEKGRRRVPAAALPKLSEVLGVPIEDLLGASAPKSKRGPAPKLLKQLDRLQQLPKSQQNIVHQMLEGICREAGV